MVVTFAYESVSVGDILKQVQQGGTVILTLGESHTPVARVEALTSDESSRLQAGGSRRIGFLRHLNLKIPDDAFDPLSDEELKEWGFE